METMPEKKKKRMGSGSHSDSRRRKSNRTSNGSNNSSPAATTQEQGQVLPQKHVLQLVIDILQRRDTYEIFAEPVDPNEVEDYYEIVKEPMDFGTMRAKLHEGMYQNLDQFKHDAFLITRNAMHFNSASTIYFRQARAIHELAKRIFHVLATAPHNFEFKFPATRTPSTRRSSTPRPRPTSPPNQQEGTCRISSSSNILLGRKKNVKIAGSTRPSCRNIITKTSYPPYSALFPAPLPGNSGDRRKPTILVQTDRRSTYTPKTTTYSPACDNPPLLAISSEEDTISYRESLSSFVKDLGATANMIASQKILGLIAQGRSHPSSSSTSGSGWRIQATPGCCQLQEDHNGPSYHSSIIRGTHPGPGSSCATLLKKTKTTPEMNVTGKIEAGGGKAVEENTGRAIPVVLALEHSNANGNAAPNEWKLKNKKLGSNRASSWVPPQTQISIPIASPSNKVNDNSNPNKKDINDDGGRNRLCSLGDATPPLAMQDKLKNGEESWSREKKNGGGEEEERVSHPFTFNLGFLKAKLNQMNWQRSAAAEQP